MKKLKLFIAALALLGGLNPISAAQTPEANGTYYLYNPTTGLFLSRGAAYGTAAWADNFGIPVTLIENGSGYRLQYLDRSGHFVSDSEWSWADGGTDRAQTYTLTEVDNGYKLINTSNNLTLYIAEGARDSGFSHQIASNGKYGDNCNENWDVWQFLSSSERDELISANKAALEAELAAKYGYTITTSLEDLLADANTFATTVKTSAITNAALSANISGWTYSSTSGGQPGAQSGVLEVYQGSGVLKQEVTGLTPGIYKVTLNSFFRDGSNANCVTNKNNGWTVSNAYLEANGVQTMIADWASDRTSDTAPNDRAAAKALFDAGKYLNEVFVEVGEDGKLNLSIAQPGAAVESRWFCFSNVTLTYYTDKVSDEDANSIIAEADALAGKVMQASLLTAMNEAKAVFESGKTVANYNVLSSAVAAAQASVNAYIDANNYFEQVAEVLETTNFYTESALAANYTDPKAKYDARTLTTEEAKALTFGTRVSGGVPAILLSPWAFNGTPALTQGTPYINTWSVEGNTDGSEFYTPFFEYWVVDANSLGAATMTATITGLTPNATYSVSMRGRVRQTNNQTKIENAVTMQVGEGAVVDISGGDKFKETAFFIGNFSAIGETDNEGNLVVTVTVAEGNNISWLSFRNLNYSDMSALVEQFNALKAEAETLLAANDVLCLESASLEAAKDAAPATFEEYTAAVTALQDAIDAFKAANVSLAVTEKAKALALGMEESVVDACLSETKSAAVAVQDIKVAEYNFVETEYSHAVELGSWVASGGTGTMTGQHWDGTTTSSYLEQSSANWGANAWTISYSQDLSLPAGNYVFKVAGRTANSDGVTMSLVVKNNDNGNELGTVNDFPKGDVGKGIDTSGATNYADDGTYANNNNGRGWEWRYVQFTLSEPATVNVAVNAEATTNHMWVSFCNATVQTDNEDNVALMEALVALNEAKNNAETLTKITANIGDGAFQYDADDNDALWNAYETAKAAVDNYTLSATSTVDEVNGLVETLATATADYKALELNAPADGQLFNVILTYEGWTYDNKAMTFIANGRTDQGNYNIQYVAEANTNLAQAFTFTKASGNDYLLSQIDADGNVRYMTDGQTGYAAAAAGIRTTTDVEKAAAFTVIATEKEGVYNIWNKVANNYIGSQDAGVYTVNSHIDFKLVETTKPVVSINTAAAGWGTIVLPFNADVPSGVTVYSCAAAEGNTLTLVEAEAVEANKPYIVEGTWTEELTGDAQGTQLENVEGWLTGVYADQAAPAGSYVLQQQGEKVGFFKVGETAPIVGANHCYLNVAAAAEGARAAFFLGDQSTTAISAIEALTSGNAQVFDASGARQPRLQKGVNIIRQADGKSFKVVVK